MDRLIEQLIKTMGDLFCFYFFFSHAMDPVAYGILVP